MTKPLVCALQLFIALLLSTQIVAGQGGGGEATTKKAPKKEPVSQPPKKEMRKPSTLPKPPTPKAPTLASLTINSNVPGATVMIDDHVGGTTDANGNLQLGSLEPATYNVTIKKAGYLAVEIRVISLSAGQSHSLNFVLKPASGTLNLTTNVSGAQIVIPNSGNYNDRVSNLSLPPGSYSLSVSKDGYRLIERQIEIKSGETTDLALTMAAVPVEDLVAKANSYVELKLYSQAIASCQKILEAHPDNARANLILGLSYYYSKEYLKGVPFLVKAVALGESARLPVKHRKYRWRDGWRAVPGYFTVSKEALSFTSDEPEHDFSVPWANVYEIKTDRYNGQISTKIGILNKKNKEEKKDFTLFPALAEFETKQVEGLEHPLMTCPSCHAEIAALYKFLTTVQPSEQEK